MKLRLSLVSFVLVVLLLAPVGLVAQVKDYVGIVRSTIHPDTVTYLEKLRDSLKSEGYINLSENIDGYLKGGFGSGFVYVAKNGKNYIITNRHVVSQAYKTSIEFERPDGTIQKYDNLSVLALDEDVDLALLAFPDGDAPFKQGLSLDGSPRTDGEDIWSAGFPALGSTPMWQLGKGTITNAVAKVSDLADPEKTTLIQHSAQVDAGNSGGPLLVTDKAAPGGYRVIGVNTWKVIDRQATNYSIPSAAISTFIARVLADSKPTDDEKIVTDRSGAFMNQLTTKKPAYRSIIKFISYEYVAKYGKDALSEVLGKAPSAVRDDILSVFAEYSPVEGLRYAIAYAIEKKVTDANGKIFVSVDSVAPSADGAYSAVFSSPSAKWNCSWIREHGLWRIATFDVPAGTEKKEKKNVSYSFDTPYLFLLTGTYGLSTTSGASNLIGVQGFLATNDFFVTGIGFANQKSDLNVSDESFGIDKTSSCSSSIVQLLVRLQVPFHFDRMSYSPYVQAGWGVGIMDWGESSSIASGYSLGSGLLVGFGADQRFFLEGGYSYRNISALSDMTDVDDMKTGVITLSAGIGLD